MFHLKHWESVVDKHTGAQEFISWLSSTWGIRLDWDYAKPGAPLELTRLLDQCFEVDRSKLDDERRALLAESLRASQQPKESSDQLTLLDHARNELSRAKTMFEKFDSAQTDVDQIVEKYPSAAQYVELHSMILEGTVSMWQGIVDTLEQRPPDPAADKPKGKGKPNGVKKNESR